MIFLFEKLLLGRPLKLLFIYNILCIAFLANICVACYCPIYT